jgi:apolipoprotein N-acyltransferase
MIRYGHISPWLAYPLLLLPVMLTGLFPALFCVLLTRFAKWLGALAIVTSPMIWVSVELLRYAVTGQLWNALGYSQAFHPALIQAARWGGVYAVSFLLLLVNSAVALLIMKRWRPALLLLSGAVLVGFGSWYQAELSCCNQPSSKPPAQTVVVAVQPNVPMDVSDDAEMVSLLERHLTLSATAITEIRSSSLSALDRLVIWPESPMTFNYSRDPQLRNVLENFARSNQTALLFNSLEPADDAGDYNSAILINQKGEKTAQYDKIRLMPFGEYVPLPRWLPGASSVRGLVGEFKSGSSYTLMPLGAFRAGVFICIEAAHPAIARNFVNENADVLINISNDGYLGPTAVMRQHLANAIFRATENNRPLLRVTNAGISANIDARGSVKDVTPGFQTAVRTWLVNKEASGTTFYTRHGDLLAFACALVTLGFVSATLMNGRLRKTIKRGL